MALELQDKVSLITGARGILGSAVAQVFHQAGARLVLVDRSERASGFDEALHLTADLTRADSVTSMVEDAVAWAGRIDVLANIAGGFEMGPPLHELSEESWDHMLDLNARTVFLSCRAILPQMLEQGSGKIINVAARAALEGKAKLAAYCASKAAVVRLTESLAADYRMKGINVNCVLPGTIDTPRNREEMPKATFDRWVEPEALAEVILFLASERARAIHGASIPVYGLS